MDPKDCPGATCWGRLEPRSLRAMIQDVDESLRALVKKEGLNGSKAEIAFDAPTREWASRRNTPTVDFYLYDIREDLDRREIAWAEVRGDDGIVTQRRPPPRRFKLSYLVTAWTQRPEDEHRLLSSLLECFLSYEQLPDAYVSGSLSEAGLPVYLAIALPPPQDRSISDVWSALGGELKPSLDLVVNTPVALRRARPAPPPVLEEPKIVVTRPDAEAETAAAGGRGKGKAAGRPVGTPGAGGAREGRLKPGEPLTPAMMPLQEETVYSGKEKRPGRILRMRGAPRS
jgi:uncharacterized protein DUF4255